MASTCFSNLSERDAVPDKGPWCYNHAIALYAEPTTGTAWLRAIYYASKTIFCGV